MPKIFSIGQVHIAKNTTATTLPKSPFVIHPFHTGGIHARTHTHKKKRCVVPLNEDGFDVGTTKEGEAVPNIAMKA